MRNGLYAKLAASNIKRNAQTYVPYIITCIIMTAMLYIMRSLSKNPGLDDMSGGYALKEILKLGSNVIRIFAFIFLFYTNSFLIKRRKKEFGLFNILGMEKRHIARVLLFESLYTAILCLVTGFFTGMLLDKLLFLVITKMLGGDVQLGFYISADTISSTTVFMLFTFLMIYLNGLRQIHLAKPVELLHGSDMGEKEPKTKWFMAVLGILLISAGYYISIVTDQPLKALTLFFVAVLCVIVGTYFFFTAGSIALLKILKKNKGYYYKINHFTTVSGMIYRMKQNAVGLANICILSTMVLVMISTTSCLLVGIEDIINKRYPYDYMMSSTNDSFYDSIEYYLHDNDVPVEKSKKYTSLVFEVVYGDGRYYIPQEQSFMSVDMDNICEFGVIDLEDYNRLTGENAELQDGSILLWSDDKRVDTTELRILDKEYPVAERLEDYPISSTQVVKSVCIVVKDKAEMLELYEMQREIYGKSASVIKNYYNFDVGEVNEKELFYSLNDHFNDLNINFSLEAKDGAHEDLMSLYGGLFFLGAFLGTLFLMQTVLIIYYKQISEGLDDKKRFEIMQNVGMSKHEVKKSIHSQIITVFFLPLIMAGIHTGFSFPLIRRLLVMFQMTNTALFALCLVVSFAAFALVYAIIYWFTAKTYYKIVSK